MINILPKLVVFVLLMLSACQPNPINMTPQNLKKTNHFSHSINVKVSGGEESDPWAKGTKIPDDLYYLALTTTMENNRLFTKILPKEQADYQLKVRILSQQGIGIVPITVKLKTEWEVLDVQKENIKIW